MRRCKTCNTELTEENTYSHHARCKECVKANQKTYYKNNKEWADNYSKEYSKLHKDKFKAYQHKSRSKFRKGFLDMYGRFCACCGETTEEFLTIEHKLGQIGIKKKEMGYEAYSKAIKEYRPDIYETLCYNCNMSKGRYGYCPHRK